VARTFTSRTTRALVGAVLLLVLTAADARAQATTVIIVRHAEKLDESADAALSPAGQQRAESLKAALEHAGVQRIITTQYQRTRGTAAPLATALGLDPVVITSSGGTATHAAEIAERVRTCEPGTIVLIVGHSNTVPDIIRALGAPDVGRIEGDEYDNLFVVLLSEAGASVVRGKY
jgi:phosphohistidine phosphatase SixA